MHNKLKFIDLFAGIGGFHIALERLGCECVFASELSEDLRTLYQQNFNLKCHGDITKINVEDIPQHDILCAGFPCQSFSKAGNQKGMNEARGKLFDEILTILAYHKPQYILLENVRNLLTHDKGYTWKYISEHLKELGYSIDKRILSPHYINIPQHRERVFIVGSLNIEDIQSMNWVEEQPYSTSVNKILSNNQKPDLEPEKIEVLKIWERFINDLPKDENIYSPLWSMEFGANYPVNKNWKKMTLKEWQKYKGNYGFSLSKCKNIEEVFEHLPNYVRKEKNFNLQTDEPPIWKQNYILNNRKFYEKNKNYISDDLLNLINNFKQESWKKFEWNCKGAKKDFLDKLIQFRGSGVRIKRNDYIPSLVTVSTQIPVIGKSLRYIQSSEASKTQSLPDSIKLPETKAGAFRVLGNMVNIELVYNTAKSLLERSMKAKKDF